MCLFHHLFQLAYNIFDVEVDALELAIVHRSGKNGSKITVEFVTRRWSSSYMSLLHNSRNRGRVEVGKR